MAPRGKQINVARDIRTLATDDYMFDQGKEALVVHAHPGGETRHFAHGEHPQIWGQGWDFHHMHGDIHWHQAEIKGR